MNLSIKTSKGILYIKDTKLIKNNYIINLITKFNLYINLNQNTNYLKNC